LLIFIKNIVASCLVFYVLIIFFISGITLIQYSLKALKQSYFDKYPKSSWLNLFKPYPTGDFMVGLNIKKPIRFYTCIGLLITGGCFGILCGLFILTLTFLRLKLGAHGSDMFLLNLWDQHKK
jgi:hypothetical protein